jgi:hypothetical protein
MTSNGSPRPAGPQVTIALLTNGNVAINVNCEHLLGLDMLGKGIVGLTRELMKAELAKRQPAANDEAQAQLGEALSASPIAEHGSMHGQLLLALAAFLRVPGVSDDLPGTLEEQRTVVVTVAEALKIEDPKACEAALPMRDILGYLLMATRLKRTRGRIAMAKARDGQTPSELVSDLLKMRAEWRKLSEGLGDNVAFPDEEPA